MSVPKSQRSESKMQFIETAERLYEYTIRAVSKIPKAYRLYNGKTIYELAQSGFRNVKAANLIYPTTQHEAEMRRDYLTRANCDFDCLLAEVHVAKNIFGLETKTIVEWIDLVIAEQKYIGAVKASDRKRFKELP